MSVACGASARSWTLGRQNCSDDLLLAKACAISVFLQPFPLLFTACVTSLIDEERPDKEVLCGRRPASDTLPVCFHPELHLSHTCALLLLSHLIDPLQVWEALSDEQRRDKETFYAGQQRTASGFMRYANTTLELLITLTGDRDIVSQAICRLRR